MNKHIIIGDVHGDYQALEKMLKRVNIIRCKHNPNQWISYSGYKAILLGDLNDYSSNVNNLSSWKTLSIGIGLKRSNVGIVLHSNHQEKLMLYLCNSYNHFMKVGLHRTINELQSLDKDCIKSLYNWLANCPLTYSFESRGITYSCVHAYYPKIELLESDPIQYKSLCINGVLNDKGKRIPWWEYPQLVDSNRIVVCGHYHIVVTKPPVIILDGNCGTYVKGVLVGYIPEKEKYIRILGSGWTQKNITNRSFNSSKTQHKLQMV